MAEVTKTGVPSIATPYPSKESLITGLIAGEDIEAADVVYLHSDGKVMKASGAAANAAARAIGFTARAAKSGEAVTVVRIGSGVMIGYGPKIGGSPAAPATRFYLSGSVAGGLADAASTGGTQVIAYAIGDGRICVDSPSS